MSTILNGPAAKTAQDIELLCNLPGTEGVIWRLVREWNPDGIRLWMEGEAARQTAHEQMESAIGHLLATCVFVFHKNTGRPVDGAIQYFRHALEAKLDRDQGKGSILRAVS